MTQYIVLALQYGEYRCGDIIEVEDGATDVPVPFGELDEIVETGN